MPRRDYPGSLMVRGRSTWYRVNIRGAFRTCTFPTTDPKEAARLARSQHARWDAELLGGGTSTRPSPSTVGLRLNDLVERFLGHLAGKVKDRWKAEGTLLTYRRTLSFFQRFLPGNPRLDEITPDHIAEYLRWRRTHRGGAPQSRKDKAETSLRTREKDYVTIRTMFNFAVDREYLARSPVKKADRPNPPPRNERVILSPEQIDLLISVCEERPMLRMWLLLLADTGMRPKESFTLRWEDLDLERALVLIGRDTPTKTKRPRTLPLSPRLAAALRAHAEQFQRPGGSPWVLHHLVNQRHARAGSRINGMNHGFANALRRAGLDPKATPYSLRHSFATNLAEAGAAFAKVSHFMGHSSLETTKRYYTHLGPESLRELVKDTAIRVGR